MEQRDCTSMILKIQSHEKHIIDFLCYHILSDDSEYSVATNSMLGALRNILNDPGIQSKWYCFAVDTDDYMKFIRNTHSKLVIHNNRVLNPEYRIKITNPQFNEAKNYCNFVRHVMSHITDYSLIENSVFSPLEGCTNLSKYDIMLIDDIAEFDKTRRLDDIITIYYSLRFIPHILPIILKNFENFE